MENPWKTLSSKIVHENPWYSVRQDQVTRPDGAKGVYNVIVKTPAVFIVAINENNEIVLIHNYRYPTQMPSVEVPSGGTDGEDPLLAAKRELQEETGITANIWKLIGTFQSSNGISDEVAYVYLAKELLQGEFNKQKEEGIYKMQTASFSQALQMIASGEISDAQSIATISMVAIHEGIV